MDLALKRQTTSVSGPMVAKGMQLASVNTEADSWQPGRMWQRKEREDEEVSLYRECKTTCSSRMMVEPNERAAWRRRCPCRKPGMRRRQAPLSQGRSEILDGVQERCVAAANKISGTPAHWQFREITPWHDKSSRFLRHEICDINENLSIVNSP